MTPLAASILGYVLGLCTALFIGAILLLLRGGADLQASEAGDDLRRETFPRRAREGRR